VDGAMASKLDQLDGKYEIIEKVREGGMGAVYKVRHRLLEELRVIKVMRPHLADDEVLRARFLREAKVAVRLRHPNLAHIYDFTVDDEGSAFLVMEFIDGVNLQEMVRVLHRPSVGLSLEIAHQALNALGYLHRKGIVHRDVSPDNLLVTRDDEQRLLVKLIDLGIAKIRGGDENLTSAGTFVGKVRYSSPEHFRSQEGEEVDARSDLYSFGIVMYEGLTGKYPIRGKNVSELIAGHLMNKPRPFEKSDSEGRVPEELRAIVLRAMAKSPDDRFASAEEFSAALDELRRRYPVDPEELTTLFDNPALPTQKMKAVKPPGSTQSRINRNFGLSETPGAAVAADATFETSGTIESSGGAGKAGHPADRQTVSQVRALLSGVERLVENHHFDEARLQIEMIESLDPGNQAAAGLMATVEAADIRRKKRRAEEAGTIQALIADDRFDEARQRLDAAIGILGADDGLNQVGRDLDRAIARREEECERARALIEQAGADSAAGDHQSAVARLNEAQGLDAGAPGLAEAIASAEAALVAQREAERRQREVTKTAAAIAGHIANNEPDEAANALFLARNLYGDEAEFSELEGSIGELRDRLRREEGERLRGEARVAMEAQEFAAAIPILERSHALDPVTEAHDLLAAAREGLRLQEEARRRQDAIDAASVEVERLLLAGRLESAHRRIEQSESEIRDLEEAVDWRRRVDAELATRTEAESRVDDALRRAVDHGENGRFADAFGALDEAREAGVDYPEFHGRIEDADESLRAMQEEHRRVQSIAEFAQRLNGHLASSDIDEARRELEIARRLFGDAAEIDELESKIERRESEIRNRQVQELVNRTLAENRGFDETVRDLEQALALDPRNETVQKLLAETREAHRRFLADRRAREIDAALADVDHLIVAGRRDEAIQFVDRLVGHFGDFPEARGLRFRLQRTQDA
jgi:serine/threonine protein kinase